MHPVRTVVYDLVNRREPRYLEGETPLATLTYLNALGKQLSYGLAFTSEEHPLLAAIEAHVLPNLGIRVSRFKRRREHAVDDYDYYVDIVNVVERGERWVVRDLYLDVLVFEGEQAKILDTDEYLAAITEGHLEADEAAYALETAHTLLNKLAQHEYNLEMYLQTEGVTLTWRKLKSTH